MKIEAQRVEKVFADERAAAYRLVRSDTPKLLEATDKLHELLAVIQKDTSLERRRREVLLVTIKWDLDKVKEIAGERRRSSVDTTLAREKRTEYRRPSSDYRRPGSEGGGSADRRTPYDTARRIVKGYNRDVTDSRFERGQFRDRTNRVLREVDKTASADTRDIGFPPDYAKRMSKRSSTGIKMTPKERAIMTALKTTIDADFTNATFEEVLEWLRKKTGCEIIADKRSLDEASVKYDTPITKKIRSSTRSVLKSILGDLGLAYIVKDEAIQILSIERARQETTTRHYYVGDLATTVDVRIPPVLSKILAMQTINQIIQQMTSTIEPRSWQVNNPDAPGSIVFNPITMSIAVKQTAEFHFMYAGK
jgi:hypothetical protein